MVSKVIITNFINKTWNMLCGLNYLSSIKRMHLDVLKLHAPSILELADRLSDLEWISGVNISLEEVDDKTDKVKIAIEGNSINYKIVKKEISECGAGTHYIDGVYAGTKIVEEINTPQDKWLIKIVYLGKNIFNSRLKA